MSLWQVCIIDRYNAPGLFGLIINLGVQYITCLLHIPTQMWLEKKERPNFGRSCGHIAYMYQRSLGESYVYSGCIVFFFFGQKDALSDRVCNAPFASCFCHVILWLCSCHRVSVSFARLFLHTVLRRFPLWPTIYFVLIQDNLGHTWHE